MKRSFDDYILHCAQLAPCGLFAFVFVVCGTSVCGGEGQMPTSQRLIKTAQID